MANDHYSNHVAGSFIIFGGILVSVAIGIHDGIAQGFLAFGVFCLIIGVIVAIPKPDNKEEDDVSNEEEV